MKTPIHLWLVVILSLLFNAGGAFDYYMTHCRNAAYMAQFTPVQLTFFYGFPNWLFLYAWWMVKSGMLR